MNKIFFGQNTCLLYKALVTYLSVQRQINTQIFGDHKLEKLRTQKTGFSLSTAIGRRLLLSVVSAMASQYQPLLNNFKQDVLAVLIVCGFIALLVLVISVDFHLPWANDLVEENEEAGPIAPYVDV